MSKLLSILAATTLAGGLALAVPEAATASAAPYCGITWGSSTKTERSEPSASVVTGVRAGRHACYDRLVLDVSGGVSWYHVEYVDGISTVGQGLPIPVRGGARLLIVANASTYDSDTGNHSHDPAHGNDLVDFSGYQTFRQMVYAGMQHWESSFGLGVRARLPFRVMVLDGPGSGSRLVVDVAHRW